MRLILSFYIKPSLVHLCVHSCQLSTEYSTLHAQSIARSRLSNPHAIKALMSPSDNVEKAVPVNLCVFADSLDASTQIDSSKYVPWRTYNNVSLKCLTIVTSLIFFLTIITNSRFKYLPTIFGKSRHQRVLDQLSLS